VDNFIPDNPAEAFVGLVICVIIAALFHSGTPRNRR
jgi:hypothetical protein